VMTGVDVKQGAVTGVSVETTGTEVLATGVPCSFI
jgi:hypothetical protein